MGKKNRNNKSASPVQNNSSVNTAPIITVKPSNEIITTEEGEKLLRESLAQMEDYCSKKRDEANGYYDDKKTEADALRGQAEAEIERRVAEAIAQERKRMKQEIADAANKFLN